MVHYICRQQILYWCRAPIYTYWEGSSCNTWRKWTQNNTLEKCRIFIMGCTNVIVVTDHQPLMGIFGDRDLSKIQNPCLFKLKEKPLRYFFTIQHSPGKWYKGTDALSRNPVAKVEALLSPCPTQPSFKDILLSENINEAMELVSIEAITNSSNDVTTMWPDHIRASGWNDQSYTTLINTTNQGFSHQTWNLWFLGGMAPTQHWKGPGIDG